MTMQSIAGISKSETAKRHIEIVFDSDFAEDNAVFKPREWVLESIAKGDGKFKFNKWAKY